MLAVAEVVAVLSATASAVFALLLTRSSTSRLAPAVFALFKKVATFTDRVSGPLTVTAKTSKSVLRSMMPVIVPVPPLSVSARAAAMVLPWSSVR